MNFKLLTLISLLLLSACTTSSVKMSPEEVQSLFAAHPELNEGRKLGLKVHLQHCDAENLNSCWKIECIGEKCWKTDLEAPPEEFVTKSKESPSVAKVACENAAQSSSVRRQGCYNYLNFLTEHNTTESIYESIRILKTMCDLRGVSCQLNYAKFGNGNFGTVDDKSKMKSGQLKVYTYAKTKTVNIYEYTVMQD